MTSADAGVGRSGNNGELAKDVLYPGEIEGGGIVATGLGWIETRAVQAKREANADEAPCRLAGLGGCEGWRHRFEPREGHGNTSALEKGAAGE